MELGWPYPKRKALLDQLAGTPSDKTQLVPSFQGANRHFNIHTVPINLPKYRLNNGRTYAAQAEFLAKHLNVERDIFEKDLESDEAQRIQHSLLKEMLGKNEKDLIEFFKTTEQTEALILTHDGFVVNGNRRLCTMRELLQDDPEEYKRFEHIQIVILPPADEKDIDELEAELQISPDIREEYTWYARALKYKKKRDQYGYTIQQLARIDKVPESEVEEHIDLLSYGDNYLEDRGWPQEYHRLEQTKYAFLELKKNREKRFSTEEEKKCFERLAYCLIDDSSSGGRRYEAIPSTAKCFDAFVTRLRGDFDLSPTHNNASNASVAEIDLFGEIEESKLGDVIEVLSDPTKYAEIRDIAIDVVNSERLKQKEQEKTTFVLIQIRKANSLILEASNSLTDHQEKKGIKQQIEALETSIKKIKDWVND